MKKPLPERIYLWMLELPHKVVWLATIKRKFQHESTTDIETAMKTLEDQGIVKKLTSYAWKAMW